MTVGRSPRVRFWPCDAMCMSLFGFFEAQASPVLSRAPTTARRSIREPCRFIAHGERGLPASCIFALFVTLIIVLLPRCARAIALTIFDVRQALLSRCAARVPGLRSNRRVELAGAHCPYASTQHPLKEFRVPITALYTTRFLHRLERRVEARDFAPENAETSIISCYESACWAQREKLSRPIKSENRQAERAGRRIETDREGRSRDRAVPRGTGINIV